jgi:putative PIN family toxin of toxin-antitoxin system
MMAGPQIVIDTNVLVAALRSNQGASFRLLALIGRGKFETNLSVPLVLEYEEAAKKLVAATPLSSADIDAVIDYLCKVSNHWPIYYLWRPLLRDPKDDMVLELAVSSSSEFIVTFNTRDFTEAPQFRIKVHTPKDFLAHIGELA